jgi:lipid II:glycine glycyltransferase (peptidoglycan interpeptide bridge formation enzyme)
VPDGADGSAFWHRAMAALSPTLRDADVVSCFVRLNPLLDAPRDALASVGSLVEHGPTIAVDLTLSAEERWSKTRSNHKRQINKARREGITTVVDDWDRLPDFIATYHETMKRVGAVDFYFFDQAYFDALRSRLGEHLHLVVAVQDDATLAGALVFECDGIVQYHLGATRDDALPQQPMKLVLTDAMAWGAERGDRVLHLGGGVGGTDDPLFHFKLGFSSWQLPYATWRVAIDPAAYGALVAERAPHADPTDLTKFFPAYREPA